MFDNFDWFEKSGARSYVFLAGSTAYIDERLEIFSHSNKKEAI